MEDTTTFPHRQQADQRPPATRPPSCFPSYFPPARSRKNVPEEVAPEFVDVEIIRPESAEQTDDVSHDAKKKSAPPQKSLPDFWLETLPLFSGVQVRFQDLMAADHDPLKSTLLKPATAERSLFSGIDWEITRLSLFEHLDEIPAITIPFQTRQLVVFTDRKKLILDPELAKAVQLSWDKKSLKKNGIEPAIIEIVRYLRVSEMTILVMLGVKKLRMSTVANYLNTTPAVLVSSVEELTQKINSLYDSG